MEAGRRRFHEDYGDGGGHCVSRARCFSRGRCITGVESFASGLANSEESADSESANTQEFTRCDGDSLNQETAYCGNASSWGSWAFPRIRLAISVPIPQMVW